VLRSQDRGAHIVLVVEIIHMAFLLFWSKLVVRICVGGYNYSAVFSGVGVSKVVVRILCWWLQLFKWIFWCWGVKMVVVTIIQVDFLVLGSEGGDADIVVVVTIIQVDFLVLGSEGGGADIVLVVTIIQLDFLVLVSEGGGADIVVVVTNNS
jgi:hypothetical protein